MVLDDSMQNGITATVLGLAVEIERELNVLRTTEALSKRKAERKTLERLKGRRGKIMRMMPANDTKLEKCLWEAADELKSNSTFVATHQLRLLPHSNSVLTAGFLRHRRSYFLWKCGSNTASSEVLITINWFNPH